MRGNLSVYLQVSNRKQETILKSFKPNSAKQHRVKVRCRATDSPGGEKEGRTGPRKGKEGWKEEGWREEDKEQRNRM